MSSRNLMGWLALSALVAGCGGGGGGPDTDPQQHDPPPSDGKTRLVVTLTPADPDVLVKVMEKGASAGVDVSAAEDGSYTFDAPRAGTYVLSLAARPGTKSRLACNIDPAHSSDASVEESVAAGQTLQLAFTPGCSQNVSGLVTDPYLNPAGTMVHAVSVSDVAWPQAQVQVQTPPHGLPYYEFQNLPNGTYDVSFEPQNDGQHFEPGTQRITVSYDDAKALDETRQHQIASLYLTTDFLSGGELGRLADRNSTTTRVVANALCSAPDLMPSSCTEAHAVVSTNLSDDVGHLPVPPRMILVFGTTVVANDWSDFMSGNGISGFGNHPYWTGSTSSGGLSGSSCNAWTSDSASDYGYMGFASSPNNFVSSIALSCDSTAPLLCVCW